MPSKNGRPGFSHRGVSLTWSEERKRYEGKVTVAKIGPNIYDRRNVYGKDRDEAKAAIEKLLQAKDTKTVTARGKKQTVEAFFTTCITAILPVAAERPIRESSVDGYMSTCRTWLFKYYGGEAVEDLDIGMLDDLYSRMYAAGRKRTTVQRQHSIIRRVLREAQVRNLVGRNVAILRGNPGSNKGSKKKRLTMDQTELFFQALDGQPRSVSLRWKTGVCCGSRQGETLGLRWEFVDYARGGIYIEWQIQRHRWKHGCIDPADCAAKHCRREACPPTWDHGCRNPLECKGKPAYCPAKAAATKPVHGCKTPAKCEAVAADCPRVKKIRRCRFHRRDACPPVCPPGCTSHAALCSNPTGGGLVFTRPKTLHALEDDEDDVAADMVFVALPATIMTELAIHEKEQEAHKERLGEEWREHDLVFCTEFGKPIDQKADYAQLREILLAIGIDLTGTHLTRRTAARLMKKLGFSKDKIGRTLRQKDPRVTDGYIGDDPDDTVATAKGMEAAFFAKAGAGGPLATVTPIHAKRTVTHRQRRAR